MRETVDSRVTRDWATQPEGQFFERKSAWDRSGSSARWRKATAIAADVADTLSAMANADGGELVVGIEDDGEVTGVDQPSDRLAVITDAARSRCIPPVAYRWREVEDGGLLLLHFTVDWSPEVHDLTDGRTLLRIRDQNMPFSQSEVAALKATKAQGLVERQYPPGATMGDIDLDLVDSLRERLRAGPSAEDVLASYGLLERRGKRFIPNLACLLLFGRDPSRWHPRCDIDFVRFEGVDRGTGAGLNVVGRERIGGPLAVLVDKTVAAVQPHVKARQRLHDLFFGETLEYPTFAWQEAVVNAVAHRDYGISGTAVDIHKYDDRLEVISPGAPPNPVTVEELRAAHPVHAARNPLIVRVLTDLGHMRELGEGIPRMFDEMERAGCNPPQIDLDGSSRLHVTLRNEVVFDSETVAWLERFGDVGLTRDQRRLLAWAHSHEGTFTSREYQKLVGTDIYGASRDIKDLIRRGFVKSEKKGGRMYSVIEVAPPIAIPEELKPLVGILRANGFIRNADVRNTLGVDRRHALALLTAWADKRWLKREGERKATKYFPGPQFSL
jgi:ATP-dependent DNA helicase RecG